MAEEVKSARIVIEVTAGLIPGKPEEEHTKRWAITSDKWAEVQGKDVGQTLAEFNGCAMGYANYLMLQPHFLNWVRVDWIYL